MSARQTATAPLAVGEGATRLDWRAELVVVALVAAEAAALWLIVSLMLASPDPPYYGVPPLTVFVLVFGAAFLPRLLDVFEVWDPAFEVVMLGGVVASALYAVKTAAFPRWRWLDAEWLRQTRDALILRPHEAEVPVWALVALVAFVWWRGRRRAEPSLDGAYTALRIGTIVVLVGGVAHAATTSRIGERAVAGAVLIFFAASLAAISLARLRLEAGRGAVPRGGRWLATFLAPILAVVVVAVVAAGIFSRNLFDTIVWTLAPLIWGVTILFRLFVLIVAVIAFVIVSPILWFLSGRELRVSRLNSTPVAGDRTDEVRREIERAADVPDPIRYLIAFVVLSFICAALVRFVLRRRRRPARGADEERESILDLGDLLAELGRRLLDLLTGIRRPVADVLAGLRGDPRWRHTVIIRETYQQLLAWSQTQGAPRPPGATPAEHAGRLRPRLPDRAARDDLDLITRRYNAARYGETPASAEEAEAVRAAWRRLDQRSRKV